jgi:superfamily II DNA helicase RecQ
MSQQKGDENLAKVKAWVAERITNRDWDEYCHQGRIERKRLAKELGFTRSVTGQNSRVKELLEEKDEGWWGTKPTVRDKAQEASIERSQKALKSSEKFGNQQISRVAELEAINRDLKNKKNKSDARVEKLEKENLSLKKKIKAYEQRDSLVESGFPGFGI